MTDRRPRGSPVEVHAPIVSGSGVQVVHDLLAQAIPGYAVAPIPPKLGLLPQALAFRARVPAPVTHSSPDLGPWIAHPDSALVTTFHNYHLDAEYRDSVDPARRLFYRAIQIPAARKAVERAEVSTAVSHFLADLVTRDLRPRKPIVVIRNGIDVERFVPAPVAGERPARVLFVGNPTRRKGIEHVAALAGELPAGAEVWYTSGMRDSSVLKPAAHERLRAIPRRTHDEMPGLYQQADVLFFPTVREGFGLAVAEAMACGLPVVATRCSSMPELVEHGRGGYLFEPGNRAQMLDYLARLVRDPGLRREMGAFNRERVVREFPLGRMVEEYRQLFAALGAKV